MPIVIFLFLALFFYPFAYVLVPSLHPPTGSEDENHVTTTKLHEVDGDVRFSLDKDSLFSIVLFFYVCKQPVNLITLG